MDAANVDLKGFTEDFYPDLCGGKLRRCSIRWFICKNETDFGLRSPPC